MTAVVVVMDVKSWRVWRGRWGDTHSVLGLNEGVVDGNDLDLGVLDGVAEDDTSNAAEAVDADLDGSHVVCLGVYKKVSMKMTRVSQISATTTVI